MEYYEVTVVSGHWLDGFRSKRFTHIDAARDYARKEAKRVSVKEVSINKVNVEIQENL